MLELTVKLEKPTDDVDDDTTAFTVRVDSHRIFTIVTSDSVVVAKWLKEILKFHSAPETAILVGVTAEIETPGPGYDLFPRRKVEDKYELLCINIGSQTLIYQDFYDEPAESLVEFFQNPRVFAVGPNTTTVARKLKANQRLEIRNPVDVNDLVVKGLKRDDLDLGRYDLDRLGIAVFGKQHYVARPEGKIAWEEAHENCYGWSLAREKVKFSTFDVYLCFRIGMEYYDLIDGAAGLKNKIKKNKKNKKKARSSEESSYGGWMKESR